MILRNYYNILARLFVGKYGYDSTSYDDNVGDGSLTLVDMNGNKRGFYLDSQQWNDRFHEAGLGYNGSFSFGTGTTPVTFDDYKLESEVSLTISNKTLGEATYDADTKKWNAIKWCNITNNTDSDVTISEVGISNNYYYGTSNTYYTNFLLCREVL